ncbi:hypothetical protein GOFOIKOB_5783 [Methylobacterium tardum]|nr:hypothetical protein [Methylobacterium tardum]GJE52709.1 hypothetical protein GOFOIKOB_5783 [Methylobacterium tardum]
MNRPPLKFGTEWSHAGTFKRYGNELTLWVADAATQEFSDAYKGAPKSLIDAGYSWTDKGHRKSGLMPCWWDLGPVDLCALANAADRAIREAAAARAEKARISEERLAREVAEVAPKAAPIRAELAAMIESRPWALGRQLSEARELVAQGDWTRPAIWQGERLLGNAKGNVERAAERLAKTPPAVWFARAGDKDDRAGALSACRILSALDSDWAAVQNGKGWSQVSCWMGHTLSERDVLDQKEAAHAIGLLHQHRRQLPDELCILIFGSAPTRRRRPAASDAPSLGL